jgi:hypothetical protein
MRGVAALDGDFGEFEATHRVLALLHAGADCSQLVLFLLEFLALVAIVFGVAIECARKRLDLAIAGFAFLLVLGVLGEEGVQLLGDPLRMACGAPRLLATLGYEKGVFEPRLASLAG